jgi:hypothetical protein
MRKSGFTLTELIAVMAAMFAIMGISVMMLFQLFDFQQTNGEYSDGIRTLDRLVVNFRSDVHTYGKPEIPAEGNVLLRWKTEEVVLDYVLEPGQFPDQQIVLRTLLKEGKKALETYRLPDRVKVWCVDGTETDAGLVALSLWTTPPGMTPPLPETLNPFDRTMPKSQVDPKYAGNWRTITARYNQ